MSPLIPPPSILSTVIRFPNFGGSKGDFLASMSSKICYCRLMIEREIWVEKLGEKSELARFKIYIVMGRGRMRINILLISDFPNYK